MAAIAQMAISHSSLLRSRHHSLASPPIGLHHVSSLISSSLRPISSRSTNNWKREELEFRKGISAVVSSSEAPVVFSDPVEEPRIGGGGLELDFSGGDDGVKDGGKGDGGGGGGGGGGGDDEGAEDGGEGEKKTGISMSQKLTLGYAALVGLGGVMGYMKSGSLKSLAAGGVSALLLLFVFTQLPVRATLASAVGLGLSAALLVVMGSRFKKSGKMFPAGVVSIVSFIMTGGYLHGIMRTAH